MNKSIAVLIFSIALNACTGVDDFNFWHRGCPGFPTVDQVNEVLRENKDIIDQMKMEGLMMDAYAVECPHGAFIRIDHGGNWQRPLMLEIMDNAGAREEGHRMFFGIPFKFGNF